jgi:endonuclease YncB( thermonuclease family)
MIRTIHPVFVLITALLLGISASSQTALSGRVVGVVDGKTFVIETENGRITGTIQYVDVPEPEQPFSRMVREHFRGLVIGKTVTFVPNGFAPTALIGKLYLNGLDLGQQLVRDGAAWHVPPDRSGQDADESRTYDSQETMAKVEKRGIWSIANMTPAWEFRSLIDKAYQDTSFIQTALNATVSEDARSYKYSKNNADMWVEVGGDAFAQQNAVGQMFWGYDADKKIRNTSTPSIAQVLVNGKRPLEVEVRAIYFQGEITPKSPNTAFVLGILATSTEQNFAGDNSVRFDVDGTEIIVGSGQRFWRGNSLSVQELSQYRISRSDLLKIANAKKLTVHVGKYAGPVGRELRDSLLKLFEVVG